MCDAIISASLLPISEEGTFDIGHTFSVIANSPHNHNELFGDHLTKGKTDDIMFLIKKQASSSLELFWLLGGVIHHKHFELVRESRLDTNGFRKSPDHIVSDVASLVGSRRGRIIDKNWIKLDVIRNWYQMCKDDHATECHNSPLRDYLVRKPKYLIDVMKERIVHADSTYEYVALSYVWGNAQSYLLTMANFVELQTEHSLCHSKSGKWMPLVIRHAIDLTRLLGERYIWVDALCIIQDEENDKKAEELTRMGDIYHNAILTIIAADGSDANHGIHGLQEVSVPKRRSCQQEIISLGELGQATLRIFPSGYTPRDSAFVAPVYTRAWTFQEDIFSRRRIVFEKGSVFWECHCTTWFEDVDCSDLVRLALSNRVSTGLSLLNHGLPHMKKLIGIIKELNHRELTYEEDRLPAFSGLASALSLSFVGGFISGLPKVFFDDALLWEPSGMMERRKISHRDGHMHMTYTSSLPSWSWVGWTPNIDYKSWASLAVCLQPKLVLRETISITEWYSGHSVVSPHRQRIASDWQTLMKTANDSNAVFPEGWSKHTGHQSDSKSMHLSNYFTHSAHPGVKFRCPVPLCKDGSPIPMRFDPLLFAKVEAATFFLSQIRNHPSRITLVIEDDDGDEAGFIYPQNLEGIPVPCTRWSLEIVAISLGKDHCLLADAKTDEYYNVLWVSDSDGVFYRRGIGRIPRGIWERSKRHKVDLVLG